MSAIVLCALTVGYARYRNPKFHQPFMAPWGMAVMGLLAFGGAWTTIVGSPVVQEIIWLLATPVAVAVCINQLRKFHGEPQFMWGLALVPPMVAATSGGQLATSAHLPDMLATAHWLIAIACFALTFVTAIPVFARVYIEVLRSKVHIPAPLTGTTWIPLGVVGQSTAAAVVLTNKIEMPHVAIIYGYIMLVLGIPLASYAAYRFWTAIASWPAYSPGWWGSTFPVGTLSLGAHMLGTTTHQPWLDIISRIALALLLIHWFVAALGAISHLRITPRHITRR